MPLSKNKLDHSDSDRILTAAFFDRAALKVASDLIGCRLHWSDGDQTQSHIITETEAYIGAQDLASHASKGRTKRTEAMFGPPGTLYVYFVYGMHWMLNVVTGPVGYPAAVLIRSVEGISGPGRLTRALGVTGKLNGQTAERETGLWLSEAQRPERSQIIATPRIGVAYAGGEWANKPYRFILTSE